MSIITRINKAEKRIVDLYNKLKNLPSGGGGVQTISGDYVDNTDPLNPILNDPRPYKVYTALLTQSGTDAPVATVLENTLGGDIVWSYYTEGVCNGELLGAFTINKTDISFGAYKSAGQAGDKINIYDDEGESEDSIKIIQQTYDSYPIDGFSNIRIEIRVYN